MAEFIIKLVLSVLIKAVEFWGILASLLVFYLFYERYSPGPRFSGELKFFWFLNLLTVEPKF